MHVSGILITVCYARIFKVFLACKAMIISEAFYEEIADRVIGFIFHFIQVSIS